MEYLTGFSFTLDSNNLKWKNYFDSLEKNSIGVYSVTKYFYDNLKDVLSKVFDNDSDITSLSPLSEESLSLSTESFKEWDVTYKDLLSEGEMCCIAIPGYLYKGSAQSCFSVVNNIIKKQVILTDSITISDYAQLVEDLFVLRFGKKPQDFTGSQIEYFIPAQQIVVSQAAINAGDVKENKVEAPQNPKVKEAEEAVEGYFYKRSTGQADSKNAAYKGNSKKVYSIEDFKESYTASDCIDLDCEYNDFRYICDVVMKECTTKNLDEYKAVAFTSKNHSNSLEQKWKTLMASGYSSVTNKTSLLDSTKTAEANLARRAVIYVLEEHDDITDGAESWDGTDFIDWGLETTPKGIKKHAKFRQYKFIEIPSTIYNSYKSNHSSRIRYSEDGHTSNMPHNPAETHTHNDGKIYYKIPAEVFKNNLTSTGDFQYDTNVSTTYGLTATLSAGESIFWKLSETKTL